MEANLKKIFEILTEKTDAEIIVVPLYNPYYIALQSNENIISEYQKAKNAFTKVLKYHNRIHILDIEAELEKTENLTKEIYDPHPNAQGQRIIAEAAIKQIVEIVEIEEQRDLQDELEMVEEQNGKYGWVKITVIILSVILVLLLIIYIKYKGKYQKY